MGIGVGIAEMHSLKVNYIPILGMKYINDYLGNIEF